MRGRRVTLLSRDGARQLDFPFALPASPPHRPGRAGGSTRPSAGHEGGVAALDAARRLREHLESRLNEPVFLTITHNRHRLVSTRRRDDGVHLVRLHHLFLDAGEPIHRALARYIGALDQNAASQLTTFVAEHRRRFAEQSRRSQLVRTRGRHHDLQQLFDALNTKHFGGAVAARVTWGPERKASAGPRRSIRLGHYNLDDGVIRIHPALDAGFVPAFYVAWVLFHEMLHAALGSAETGARHRHHSQAFRARERTYPDYERARAWERAHLDELL